MDFKVYFKHRISSEVKERVAVRIDSREGVVWLKDGGWIMLDQVYLTRKRAETHEYEEPAGMSLMKPSNEK